MTKPTTKIAGFAEVHRRPATLHLKTVDAGVTFGSRKDKLAVAVETDIADDSPAESQRKRLASRPARVVCLALVIKVFHTNTLAR